VGGAPEGYDGHLTFYIAVPDVEEALQRAESLGGTRVMGPDEIPGQNGLVIGLFNDPDGHMVGVLTGGG
jgi:predicted enzyme related to lactoylglutathione lyase